MRFLHETALAIKKKLLDFRFRELSQNFFFFSFIETNFKICYPLPPITVRVL